MESYAGNNFGAQSASSSLMVQGTSSGIVLLQRAPVYDGSLSHRLCHLTICSSERSLDDVVGEIVSLREALETIDHDVVISVPGVDVGAVERAISLPRNIEFLRHDGFDRKQLSFGGENLQVGWEWMLKPFEGRREALPPSEANIIRLLGLVEQNADVEDIEDLIKRDVALQYNLLRYLNSAHIAFRTGGGFKNFHHAILLLGYRQLGRYLGMFLLHEAMANSPPMLYRASIIRARQMELIATSLGWAAAELDRVFLTGAFSLVDKLLGVSMEKVVAALAIKGPMEEALLRQTGPFAPLLAFAVATECATEYELYTRQEALVVDPRAANLSVLRALKFAAEIN